MSKYNSCHRCEREIDTDDRYDAKGIFITRCCDDCWKEVKKGYREDVLNDPNYWTDEPVDED